MWRLTGGDSFATDVTNASRTMFMDLKTLRWSPACLKTLGIPAPMLPQIRDSDAEFGRTRGLNFLPDGIPITGVLGDQQAALFGQECWEAGMAKCTYGTGAFVLLNTGTKVRRTKSGVSTVAWKIKGKPTYCLEGSLFIAGAAVQWLRDGLGLLESSAHIEKLAAQVESSDGVFFIPALTGLGSPYWAPQAKGLIGGLTRRSTKSHVARACLEGIGYSVADLFEALVKDALVKLRFLRVDGGASRNEMLLKFQSDLMGVTIQRPSDIESTARGAGFVAALGAGIVRSTKELAGKNPVIFEVKPALKAKESKALLAVWRRRVKALLAGCY
jgi:glycerol kinase